MSQRKHFSERVAFEKGYRVSPCGTIISSPYGGTRKPWSNNGYLCFSITTPEGDGQCSVHRLQAYQKYGEQIYEPGYARAEMEAA